jgi:ketosteroid isomerase-like protein
MDDGDTMIDMTSANIATVREYLRALEQGASGDELARFFTAEARQIELPNRLNPAGGESDLTTLLKRAEQGQKLLRDQRFEIRSEVAQDQCVAVEAVWTAVLATPLSTLAAGARMKAYFAMFFELDEGRIAVQRNYDCFESW